MVEVLLEESRLLEHPHPSERLGGRDAASHDFSIAKCRSFLV